MRFLKNFITIIHNKIMENMKKKLITHDGSFHADDVFTSAALALLLEKKGEAFEIIRTRNEEAIDNADIVFDVGGIYDETKNRFDHHQKGGAGGREVVSTEGGDTIIEYSSFGLVWKKFGIEICENQKVVDRIDKKLVASIDAGDNGLDLVTNKYEISQYLVHNLFSALHPTWREENLSINEMFVKSVEIAKLILSREIIQTQDALLAEEKVIEIYKNSEDKRIIILDKNYPYEYTLRDYVEPLFVIYPRTSDGFWGVKAVRGDLKTFRNKKDLPSSWAGLNGGELQSITGVSDAVFCHRGLFITAAETKEGAIKLAQIAVES